jgi:hypothetical protein
MICAALGGRFAAAAPGAPPALARAPRLQQQPPARARSCCGQSPRAWPLLSPARARRARPPAALGWPPPRPASSPPPPEAQPDEQPPPGPAPTPPPPRRAPSRPCALGLAAALAGRAQAWAQRLVDAALYAYYNSRSPSTDLRFFVGVYAWLLLGLAAAQHCLLEPCGLSFFSDLYLVSGRGAARGAAVDQHARPHAHAPPSCVPRARAAPAMQVSRWLFGEEFPPAGAPGGQKLLAVLTAVSGLLGFALILALVEQARTAWACMHAAVEARMHDAARGPCARPTRVGMQQASSTPH